MNRLLTALFLLGMFLTSNTMAEVALDKYCPGWCCPSTSDESLREFAWEYCKKNPNATRPSKELQTLFNIDKKVEQEIIK